MWNGTDKGKVTKQEAVQKVRDYGHATTRVWAYHKIIRNHEQTLIAFNCISYHLSLKSWQKEPLNSYYSWSNLGEYKHRTLSHLPCFPGSNWLDEVPPDAFKHLENCKFIQKSHFLRSHHAVDKRARLNVLLALTTNELVLEKSRVGTELTSTFLEVC